MGDERERMIEEADEAFWKGFVGWYDNLSTSFSPSTRAATLEELSADYVAGRIELEEYERRCEPLVAAEFQSEYGDELAI